MSPERIVHRPEIFRSNGAAKLYKHEVSTGQSRLDMWGCIPSVTLGKSMQKRIQNRIERILITVDFFRDPIKLFLKRTMIKLGCLLFLLIIWKSISADWVVKIPKTAGGFVRYYPRNSPVWNPPRPTLPFSTFQEQFSAEFGSGSGPSLYSNSDRISLNWIMISAKIFFILIISGIIFVIRGIWLAMTRPLLRE